MNKLKKFLVITLIAAFVVLLIDFGCITVTVDAISDIVISPQSCTLTYGEANTVNYKVTGIDISNDNIQVKWYNKEENLIDKPNGVICGCENNIFTITTTAETPAGTYKFTIINNENSISETLEITKRSITLYANSATKVYDGKPLKNNNYDVGNSLAEGDELKDVTIEGSITDVGVATNKVISYKIMHGDIDVTVNYDVKCENGILQVTAPESQDVKVDTDALKDVLNKYENSQDNSEKKQLFVKFDTEKEVSKDDIALIENKLVELNLSDKNTVYFNVELTLEVNDSNGIVTKNIGDENTQLIATTYNFDFTNKSDISVHRLHTDKNDVKSFDEITTTENENGEYVEFNKDAKTIIIRACKYSTFVVSYNIDAVNNDIVEDNYEHIIVNTGIN